MEQIIKDFIGVLENARIMVKALHWGSKNMSTHKLMDDISDSLADHEDTISEACQGIIGKFEAGEIKVPQDVITSPKEFIDYIITKSTEFHEQLGDDKKYIGVRSEVEALITDFNKFVLLIGYALNENKIRNMVKESLKNIFSKKKDPMEPFLDAVNNINSTKTDDVDKNVKANKKQVKEDYNPNEYDDDPVMQDMKKSWRDRYGEPKAPEKAVKVSRPFRSGKYNYRLVVKPSKYGDGMALHVEMEHTGRKAEYDKSIGPKDRHYNTWRNGGESYVKDDWDGIPSGWSYTPGKRHPQLTIDGGQGWVVNVPREAWDDLERQTENTMKISENKLRSIVESIVRKRLSEGFGSDDNGINGFGPYQFNDIDDTVIVDKALGTVLLDHFHQLEAFTEMISPFEREIDLADLGATYGDRAYNQVVNFIKSEKWRGEYEQNQQGAGNGLGECSECTKNN
jgi:hypothetical protein